MSESSVKNQPLQTIIQWIVPCIVRRQNARRKTPFPGAVEGGRFRARPNPELRAASKTSRMGKAHRQKAAKHSVRPVRGAGARENQIVDKFRPSVDSSLKLSNDMAAKVMNHIVDRLRVLHFCCNNILEKCDFLKNIFDIGARNLR